MKAADARTLKVGDWVKASFGCYEKSCEIIKIDWPRFTLSTRDYRGEEMIRTRRYQILRRRKRAMDTLQSMLDDAGI